MQHTSEKSLDTLEVRVYTGADGQFTLYSDEGDTYNYEKGKYKTIFSSWNEQQQTLAIGKQQGDYAGALKKHVENIVWASESNGNGIELSSTANTVVITSERIMVLKR